MILLDLDAGYFSFSEVKNKIGFKYFLKIRKFHKMFLFIIC